LKLSLFVFPEQQALVSCLLLPLLIGQYYLIIIITIPTPVVTHCPTTCAIWRQSLREGQLGSPF
jgi:hypothetical protein